MTTPDKTKTVAQILKRNALIEAEQKRVKTLPRGWNAVKDYVFTGKVNKWVYFVSCFPAKGKESQDNALRCKTFARASLLAHDMNCYQVVPA